MARVVERHRVRHSLSCRQRPATAELSSPDHRRAHRAGRARSRRRCFRRCAGTHGRPCRGVARCDASPAAFGGTSVLYHEEDDEWPFPDWRHSRNQHRDGASVLAFNMIRSVNPQTAPSWGEHTFALANQGKRHGSGMPPCRSFGPVSTQPGEPGLPLPAVHHAIRHPGVWLRSLRGSQGAIHAGIDRPACPPSLASLRIL